MSKITVADIKSLPSLVKEKPKECKGLIFRAWPTIYVNGGEYVETTKMRLLKRKSCKGCPKCDYMMSDLHEQSCDGRGAIMPEIPNPNKMYKLEYTNIGYDWETGYVDDWEMEFVEFKDEVLE